jgi:hypothetical protein
MIKKKTAPKGKVKAHKLLQAGKLRKSSHAGARTQRAQAKRDSKR